MRPGAVLLAAGALPFVAGRVLYDPAGADLGGPELVCPFRAATGLPCPLCGSTRAVVLAAHGDGAFWQYNAVTVVVLAALAVLGLALLVRPALRPRLARLDASPGLPLLVIGAVAWVWTLTHQDTIVG